MIDILEDLRSPGVQVGFLMNSVEIPGTTGERSEWAHLTGDLPSSSSSSALLKS